jgi:predicted transcriptional regulator
MGSGSKVRSKRRRLAVVYDILCCCSGSPLINTVICRRANLNNNDFLKLTKVLLSCGFLTKIEVGDQVSFVTSRLGRDFIKSYNELQVNVKPLEASFGVLLR